MTPRAKGFGEKTDGERATAELKDLTYDPYTQQSIRGSEK